MKEGTFFIIILLIGLLPSFVHAGGVGITPVYYKEFFQPNLEKTYSFHAFNTQREKGVEIYATGDLAEYVTLSDTYFVGDGQFTATIKLPDKIEKPGRHSIVIGAMEVQSDSDKATFGGIAAIQGRIDIMVPYPGRYSETSFSIGNINEGEEASYEISTENLGSQALTIDYSIEIYKDNFSELVIEEQLTPINLRSKETTKIMGVVDTRKLSPGDYQARLAIDWGQKEHINQSFKVGQFLVEIMDYDYRFIENQINQFNIRVQNKWNTKIDQIYATVSISEEGKVLADFKTVSIDTDPWETKNLTGYFDTTGLDRKRYTANILLNYGGEVTSKLVAIYIEESPRRKYTNLIIIATVVILVIILTYIYMILKIRKLSKKNGKKK